MHNTKKRRLSNAVNAGSMADIAFLLLIFFLVTTTIDSDTGLRVLLPPITEGAESVPLNDSNVFNVKINAANELLVEKKRSDISRLTPMAKQFIQTLGDKGEPAVISLQNDRGTNYEMYLSVYDKIKKAYNELWEETAQRLYHKPYNSLRRKDKKAIQNIYPLVISEAEPTGYGE